MKKAGGVISILLLLLISKDTVFAETTIKNGDSTSNIRVNTNTNGGTVSTHIETTVNGKTQIIESHEEGEIIVENNNGEVTVKKSTPNTTITNITKTPTPTSTESASIDKEDKDLEKQEETKNSIIKSFLNAVENFVRKILDIF